MSERTLADRVNELEALAFRAGVRTMLTEGWLELRDLIPPSERKIEAERWFEEWSKAARGKGDQRLFREALGQLALWLEGWEAARASVGGKPDEAALRDLVTVSVATRAYLRALDAVREIAPGRWLNLKGAARQKAITKRRDELKAAERVLRELTNPR